MGAQNREAATPVEEQLRYLQFVLTPETEGLHPADEQFAEHPELTRERILNTNLLPDGTASVLYQLGGDVQVARSVLEKHDRILGYNVSRTGASIHAYIHVEATAALEALLRIPEEFDIITDLPFEYTSQGGLRIRVVGDFEAIRQAWAAVPDVFRLHPERMGQFDPATERLFNQLTERQQQTLVAAVQEGYYRNPREATYEEIGDVMDRTDGTVGEHLRKIEEYVMQDIIP